MNIVRGVEAARHRLRRARETSSTPSPEAARRTEAIFGQALSPEEAVDRIIADVAASGDQALRRFSKTIDGVELTSLRVAEADLDRACDSLDESLIAALEEAADRIRAFHQACLPVDWFDEAMGLGQAIHPLGAVGLYVPGGTAAYPSVVLHTAVPARVAGVNRVVVTTPPQRDGGVAPAILAAAKVAGVSEVYRVGGAQAIAALAFGTESIPRVDKVFGPGNIYVTTAKRKLYGVVGVDGLYGPTETLIIADDSADPALCAADLLAQAEHDELATPVLLTNSDALAESVVAEVKGQMACLERKAIAEASISGRGVIVVLDTIDEAVALANDFAPEHLCLLTQDPRSLVPSITRAGGIFIGEASPEVLGDYNAGPSHVMPTGGTARFASALGLHDFVRVTSLIGLNKRASQGLYDGAARIARAEGLTGHARSAELRLEGRKRQ